MSTTSDQPCSDGLWQRALAARRDLDENRLPEAIVQLDQLSAAGEQLSQVTLGWLYEIGKGVTADPHKAERLYAAAAEAGYRVGQYYLGSLLARQGRDADAATWYARAAERGYPPAEYCLGRMLEEGRGVPRDKEAAERYIEKAALAGHLFARRWVAARDLGGRNGIWAFARAVFFFVSIPALAIMSVRNGSKDPNLAPS